jgi:hypothetical protein
MADLYVAASEAINLGAATALVNLGVVSSAGARRMALNELGVTFNGTSSTATPVTVRLVRVTGAVSGGGTATQSPTPLDSSAPASTFTSYQPTTATPGVYTTAPTVGVILRTWYVPPTSGLVVQFPLGQEPDGPATTNAGLAIQCNAPAAVTVNAYLLWSE